MAYPATIGIPASTNGSRLKAKSARLASRITRRTRWATFVYVDAPKVGDTVTAKATFGSVESVKAVSDLYSPVSGTVTAVNEALKTEPDKINQDAHGAWIIKVELSDPGEVADLLDAAAYEAFIAEETN